MNGTACITIVGHMALRWTSKYARVIYSNCRILQTFISLVENLLYNVRETLRRFISHLVYRRLISCALAIDRLVNSDRRSVGRRLISLQSGLRYERGAFPFFSYSDNRFYSYNYDRDRINHASENLLAEPPCHSCLPEGALSLSFSQSCRGMTYKHYTSECDTLLPLYICTIMRHSYPHGYNRALSLPVHVIASLRLYARSTTRPRRLLSTCLRKPSKAILQRKKIYNYVLNARSTCVC